MDHHCKWVNNCVGVKTHKFFLLFVLYFTLAAGVACSTMSHNVYSYFYAPTPSLTRKGGKAKLPVFEPIYF